MCPSMQETASAGIEDSLMGTWGGGRAQPTCTSGPVGQVGVGVEATVCSLSD